MFLSILIAVATTIFGASTSYAQEEQATSNETYFRGEIIKIVEGENGSNVANVNVISGDRQGDKIDVQLFQDEKTQSLIPQPGDEIVVLETIGPNQEQVFFFVDYVRTVPLALLFGIFVAIVIGIGRWNGVMSIIGMLYTFVIISQFVVPNIIRGNNPILIAILGGALITPVTYYTSHGINWKSSIAVFGTVISLIMTGILAFSFVEFAKLTGFGLDDSVYINTYIGESIDIKSLLLAGIIISTLGVLDDITVSQSAIVFMLIKTNKSMPIPKIFTEAMNIGRDHIASLVNTLILVYAGASLPLFMLFHQSQIDIFHTVSNEIVATEIVRTLVGSVGLVAAVPITTFLATLILKRQNIS